MNNLSLTKTERLAKTEGARGWAMLFGLLGIMCFDQFVAQIPFANLVFPILIICAASMNTFKNMVIITVYSVVFELSCVAWLPADLLNVGWWLLEVIIGYAMPFIVYKTLNRKHKNLSIFTYSALASLAELMYFWVSIIATILIWRVNPIAYILSDLPYQAVGCVATFVCTIPVAAIYKLTCGELAFKRKSKCNA